jgi:hypothetical protein
MGLHQPSDAQGDLSARQTRADHKGIARQARRVQVSFPVTTSPHGQGNLRGAPFGIGLIPAIVTTAIPAGSGTTPSKTGRAQLYYLDDPDDAAATADADRATETILCWYTSITTVAIGKNIWVASWSGALWFITGDC